MQIRRGIFGGSFDPVHYGHLILAETCREALELDQVCFVPAATSPLKPQGPVASGNDRLEMLQLAIGGSPNFTVEPHEIERGGVSYTIDTVTHLKRQYPEVQWVFLLGADALHELDRWQRPDALLQLVELGVVNRSGHPAIDLEVASKLLPPGQRDALRASEVQIPAIEISSSELRQRIADGRSIRFRTPRAVEAYIATHQLYRAA